MLFNATITNHKFFSNIFEAISNILETGNLIINNDSMKISGMDSSHISLIELNLNKKDFDSFELNTERPINIGMNFPDFVKILKIGDLNDKLILEYENNEELFIHFNDDEISRKFAIKLLDVDTNELKPPNIDFNMNLHLSTKLFTKILNSFTITDAEYITFCVKENLLSIKSDGSSSKLDMDFKKTESFVKSKKLKINSKNEKSVEEQEEIRYKLNKCEGNFNASFGISLLKKMNKTNTIVDSLQCNLSPDMPIRFDYKLSKNSNINFYLSPKYEVD